MTYDTIYDNDDMIIKYMNHNLEIYTHSFTNIPKTEIGLAADTQALIQMLCP